MTPAGELLRCERIKQNRSLPEIAAETCISTRYLEAIEQDNPGILPGDFFHRSFIRQYANALRLDEAIIREILEAIGPPAEIDPIPAFNLPQQIAEVEQAAKPLAQIPTRVAAMLLLVVLVGCSGLYALWNRAQEAADPAMQQVAAPTSPLEESHRARAGAAQTQSEAATEPDPQPVALLDPGTMDINLAAREQTWVKLSSHGKTVYSGVLAASESRSFEIGDQGRLVTGNAAGLDLSINGRAVGPLGERGQVRLILLGQDNFQIISPGKM